MLVLYAIYPYNTMKKRLDFRLEDFELELLEDYCKAVGRTKSDVLRELIRNLRLKKKPSF
jgi:predicted DNA-binding protein